MLHASIYTIAHKIFKCLYGNYVTGQKRKENKKLIPSTLYRLHDVKIASSAENKIFSKKIFVTKYIR